VRAKSSAISGYSALFTSRYPVFALTTLLAAHAVFVHVDAEAGSGEGKRTEEGRGLTA
jgi:hypothetical protein